MSEPNAILDAALRHAHANLRQSLVDNQQIREDVDYVARNLKNRAGVRLLLACLLAKLHRPDVDIRKPYTEIGEADTFSGRTYDERYITPFINAHNLPCNSTTAFLTPALRNRNTTLTRNVNLVGKPPKLYQAVLRLLDDVHSCRVSPDVLMTEIVRLLLVDRNDRQQRIEALVATLNTIEDSLSLSSEGIVSLIEKHMSLRGTSRLAVLVVAAAYQTAEEFLREKALILRAHNAADFQTGALGDVEVTLIANNEITTSYEMKNKRVTHEDVDRALQKLILNDKRVNNYIFITTEPIDDAVQEYAKALYIETGGIEFVILDCIGFIRHFLHLFHKLRNRYLEIYQALILAEPQSAVSQPVKEAFLAMRQAAETGIEEGEI
ncbi:MAG: restriction endonuclease, SacI family [Leptolyngbyaceae cyanobacterium bins.349]|nr:restriction endonuclease, SacI family [Leptolyngbyaceae cyanobacterium bins.349]